MANSCLDELADLLVVRRTARSAWPGPAKPYQAAFTSIVKINVNYMKESNLHRYNNNRQSSSSSSASNREQIFDKQQVAALNSEIA